MAIIFHKDTYWFQAPNIEQQQHLLASKNKMFCFADECHLDRKIRKCYPRGRAYSKLESLEYRASKYNSSDYPAEKLRALA
ncbi:hypothetical protein [Xenorhabdus bovienii]|uniref:hypothetical protein n=1 Tax=Xenorhabdus bovienii TaxID=40576 RepID=UPI00056DAABA|nr:hypothetical protein [Xenorhabdus bovienii]